MRSASIREVLGEVRVAALLSGWLLAPPPFVSFLVSVGDAWWRVIHSGVESLLGAPPSPNPFAAAWSWNQAAAPPPPQGSPIVTLLDASTHYYHA